MRLLTCIFLSLCLCALGFSSSLDKNKLLHISVSVTGLPQDMSEAVTNNLSIIRYNDYARRSVSNLELLFGKSKEEIDEALIPFGYYHPIIDTNVTHNDNYWVVHFAIQKGPPMAIAKFDVNLRGQAQKDYHFLQKLKQLELKPGAILTQEAYKNAKTNLVDLAFNRGYFNAELNQHTILVEKAENKARVELSMDSGKRYRIGKIHIKQKEFQFDTSFVKRFLNFHSGQYFNMDHLNNSQNALQSSPYFSSVAILPKIRSEQNQTVNQAIPIDVDLTAKKPVTYTIGTGYGTFTGPRVLGGVILRHLTRTGQYAKFSVEASPINTTFLGEYIIPGKNPATDFYSINAQQSFINTIPYNARQTTVGADIVRQYNHWISTIGLHQYYIRYTTQANSSNPNAYYLVPVWQLQYRNQIPDGFWKKGWVISNQLQAALKSVISSNTFVRNRTSIRFSLPLMKQWNRFLATANFGALYTQNIQDLAAPFRFYAGGVGNLIGYPYLSQGPSNAAGNLIGGKYIMTAATGLEQRIYGKFSVLGFYNIGNASNKIDMSDVQIKQAAGIGLAYQSPLGPIQVYLSRRLNKGDEGWRFDFSVGITL